MKKSKVSKRSKKFFSGFKDFITKGNVIDLAVAVIIGAAFKEIVNVLVAQIIMPPIGLLIGNMAFADLTWNIGSVLEPVYIGYGLLIQTIIEFVIIAFVIYAVINLVIRRRQFIESVEKVDEVVEPVVEEPVISDDILLLTEIRDLLREQKEVK